jgi:serine/threonine protein kinase
MDERPPEILFGQPYATIASDIWACGCTIYNLLTFKLPFGDNNNTVYDQAKQIIVQVGFPTPMDIPNIYRYATWNTLKPKLASFWDAIGRKTNNTFRDALIQFPNAFDLLSKMLALNPNARPTIYEVLQHPFFTTPQFHNKGLFPTTAAEFVYKHIPGSYVHSIPTFDYGKMYTDISIMGAYTAMERKLPC